MTEEEKLALLRDHDTLAAHLWRIPVPDRAAYRAVMRRLNDRILEAA